MMDDPPQPRGPRRRRLLSSEERALWDTVARSAKPLRKRPRALAPPSELDEQPKAAAAPKAKSDGNAPRVAPAAAKPKPPPLAAMGRRERTQISRGHKDIDARIDLHGMTQARAHRALLSFLLRARSEGHALVLVITGRGRTGTGPERGVLRRQVPIWFALPEFRELVIGFSEAHIGHGGEGALYVRVRRGR